MKKFDARIVFLGKFFGIFAVLYALVEAMPLNALNEWIAGVEASVLGAQGAGNAVVLGGNFFLINNACSGLISIALLAAAIFSFRKPEFRKKIHALGLGALVLFPLNLARIFAVLLVGKEFGIEAAEIMHVISWFVVSAAVIGSWHYLNFEKIEKL